MYAGGSSGVGGDLAAIDPGARYPGQGRLAGAQRVGHQAGRAGGNPRYRLEVELDDNITGFGIRGDRATTRERRTLRARYRLVELSTGAVVLDATAGSDAGIDVVSSQYATIAAEQTALERLSEVVADQMVGRLALFVVAHTGERREARQGRRSGGRSTGPTRRPASICSTVPTRPGLAILRARLLASLGAEKFAVVAGAVKADPAVLADEAGAMALFGGPRAIWIEPAGDEIADGVAGLLDAPGVESPVIAIGGALRKTSGLVKLAEAHALAAAVQSYIPGRDATPTRW